MILECPLGFHRKRKCDEQKLCYVEIWIEEILTLLKARRGITEIIFLLKYEKQTVTGEGEGCPYVVVIYCLYKIVDIQSAAVYC